MTATKQFKTFEEQAQLLASRGMDVGTMSEASEQLKKVNYYRLSGYWRPLRRPLPGGELSENFIPGTTLADVMALYEFDARLRVATFAALAPVETSVRALLGNALAQVSPTAHLDAGLLGADAHTAAYANWCAKLQRDLQDSREPFIVHHRDHRGGVVPVWVAIEILDWGGLTWLLGFTTREVKEAVAEPFGLKGTQIHSWMRALNLVRNVCAHHSRFYNRAFTFRPRLPTPAQHPELFEEGLDYTRAFGQLTMLRFLLLQRGLGGSRLLRSTLGTYPDVDRVPISDMGVPEGWQRLALWQ